MQMRLDFEPGITDQFKTLKRCVAAVVHNSKAGLDGCAAACDVAPSTLSRMLNDKDDEDNRRHLPVDFIPIIVGLTGDTRPIQWLCAKFLPNEEQRKEATIARIESMLPELVSALSSLKGSKK
jgi:hypothetical protein